MGPRVSVDVAIFRFLSRLRVMGWTYSTQIGNQEMYAIFRLASMKGEVKTRELCVDGRIILKWILQR
jgi:hypothetical protein